MTVTKLPLAHFVTSCELFLTARAVIVVYKRMFEAKFHCLHVHLEQMLLVAPEKSHLEHGLMRRLNDSSLTIHPQPLAPPLAELTVNPSLLTGKREKVGRFVVGTDSASAWSCVRQRQRPVGQNAVRMSSMCLFLHKLSLVNVSVLC